MLDLIHKFWVPWESILLNPRISKKQNKTKNPHGKGIEKRNIHSIALSFNFFEHDMMYRQNAI